MEMNKNYNNNWLKWFIELNDAEGNFQTYPKKRLLNSGEINKINVGYSYHLSKHKRDIGKIRKEMFQLFISSKKDIENLIMFLDDKNNIPLQGYKNIQYNEWKKGNSV